MPRNNVYFWGHEHKNWGDNLTPHVYKWITGHAPRIDVFGTNRLVMIGSLSHVLHENDHVWGTGMLSPSHLPKVSGLKFHAVRGPLTRKVLMDAGYDVPMIYGDPGVFMPLIYPMNDVVVDCEVGIIPHYADMARISTQFSGTGGIRIIDICSGVKNVMQEVARCNVILSTSLHGVILAESLGKHAAHIMVSNELTGGTFKFDDWYLSSGRDSGLSLDCRDGLSLDIAIAHAMRIPPMELDTALLLKSFPEEWK